MPSLTRTLPSLVLLILTTVVECKVELPHSTLFDGFDLDVVSVNLTKCNDGCVIYAALPSTRIGNAEVLNIYNAKNKTKIVSIENLASRYVGNYGNRWGLNLPAGEYTVENSNRQPSTTPPPPNQPIPIESLEPTSLALYVVSTVIDGEYKTGYPVYDPRMYKHSRDPAQRMTFLGMDAFSFFWVQLKSGENLRVLSAGYDAFDLPSNNSCTTLLESNHDDLLYTIVPVSSPIATVDFGSVQDISSPIILNTDSLYVPLIPGTVSAVASPGFISCSNGQRFRYKKGPQPVLAQFDSTESLNFTLEFDVQVDKDDKIAVNFGTGENITMYGGGSTRLGTRNMNGSMMTVSWQDKNADNDDDKKGSFLIKITAHSLRQSESTLNPTQSTSTTPVIPDNPNSTIPSTIPTITTTPRLETTTSSSILNLMTVFTTVSIAVLIR